MSINLNNPSRLVRSIGRILWLIGWLPLVLVSGLFIGILGVLMFLLLIAEWLSGGGMTWADAVGEFMYQSVNGMWAKWNILKFS